jgi:small-conductance mechanosensitive channel
MHEFWISTRGKILILFIFLVSLLIIRRLIIGFYRRKKKIEGRDNFTLGVDTIFLIGILLTLFFGLLTLVNVEIKQFFTSISIIAAAIAILSKDYFSNAINGMILMFNNQVSLDDYVKVGDQKGRIVNITLMNVHLMNEEGDLVLVPNSVLLTSQIINYTKGDTRRAQMEVEFKPEDIVDLKELEAEFKKTVEEFDEHINLSSFTMKIAEVSKDSVKLKLNVMLEIPDSEVEKKIRRKWLYTWVNYINKPKV